MIYIIALETFALGVLAYKCYDNYIQGYEDGYTDAKTEFIKFIRNKK